MGVDKWCFNSLHFNWFWWGGVGAGGWVPLGMLNGIPFYTRRSVAFGVHMVCKKGKKKKRAGVAQQVEQLPCKQRVEGSIPSARSMLTKTTVCVNTDPNFGG